MLKKMIICCAALGFMMNTLCLAEQKEWIDPGGCCWFTPDRWNPPGVPGIGDDLYVYKGNPLIDDSELGDAYAKSVSLLGSDGIFGILTVGGTPISLYVTGDFNIGTNDQGGELRLYPLGTVSCHSFTLVPPGKVDFQGGTLIVEGGTFDWPGDNLTIQSTQDYSNPPSTLVLSGFTTSRILYDQTQIGYDADLQGRLKISNGTNFEANPAIGVGPGSHGTIIVTGKGSYWSWGGGTTVIGGSGHAEIIVEKGGYLSVDYLSSALNIAAKTGSQAEITVRDNPSKWEVYNAVSYEVVLGKTGTASLLAQDGGKVLIEGTLRCTGTGTITVSSTTDKLGQLEVGSLIMEAGSLLTGGGGNIKGSVNCSGRLSPGSSAGTMTIDGDFTQQSGGTLEIELGGTTPGTDYDVLDVIGKATLVGTLDVKLINGFSPKAADTFQIINFGSQSGCFETINLPSLDAGFKWDTHSLCTTGIIGVTIGDPPVPVPTPTLNEWGLIIFSVLLIGSSLLIIQRRKNVIK